MQYFKTNIFGVLAVLIGAYLLFGTVNNINDIQKYNELKEVGEYIKIQENADLNVQPTLMAGGIKVSLIFLSLLLIPVILVILHNRRKGDKKIVYLAMTFVLINFLLFPYYLTQLFNTINTIK